MLETKQKGIVTQLQCLTEFNELGLNTSIPYGENSRYDFIVDINGHLLRVQAKTSSGVMNSDNELAGIKFACRSSRSNAQGASQRKYTKDEIDYFCTFWDGICYVVPVEETSMEKILRFFYPKNGQKNNISLAEDYTIDKQWSKYLKDGEHFEKFQSNLSKTKSSTNHCKRCGKIIDRKATYCVECSHYFQRSTQWPSRDKLKALIRTTPFTKIGEQFKVTDNAVRKWCKSINLPSRTTDIKKYSDQEWEKI